MTKRSNFLVESPWISKIEKKNINFDYNLTPSWYLIQKKMEKLDWGRKLDRLLVVMRLYSFICNRINCVKNCAVSCQKNVKMQHYKEIIVSACRNSLSVVSQFLVLVQPWFVRPAKATCDTLINHCYVGESRLSAAGSPSMPMCATDLNLCLHYADFNTQVSKHTLIFMPQT